MANNQLLGYGRLASTFVLSEMAMRSKGGTIGYVFEGIDQGHTLA
jgi:hypothetical protein